MVLKGRLGLDTARVPQADRHGLVWLERGRVTVESGTLVFATAGSDLLKKGAYDLPYQQISNLLLGPGSTISHDALRLLARHQTGLLAIGSHGVRLYAASMPFGPDRAKRARRHARLWSEEGGRITIARAMYAQRIGEALPGHIRDMNTLRGIEGRRVKRVYQNLANQHGVEWKGRRYDRNAPEEADAINKAINHAAAHIAVAVTGTVPQLGFIHESSGRAFALDVADLFRSSTTLPIAFQAVKRNNKRPGTKIEATTRRLAGRTFRREDIIPQMIDRIKGLLDGDDSRGNA